MDKKISVQEELDFLSRVREKSRLCEVPTKLGRTVSGWAMTSELGMVQGKWL